ncbi:MAG: hypothetical protein ACSHX9_09845 [Luteolibacter sp.]
MSLESNSLEVLRGVIARAAARETEEPATPLPGVSAADEKQQLEIDGLKAKQAGLEAEIGRLGDIHIARIIGLGLLFLLIVGWLMAILQFLYWSGTPANWNPNSKNHDITVLKLSDPVIMALIGSTTINVLGLFYVAARWLYGEKQTSER